MSHTAVVLDFYGTLTPGRAAADQLAARRRQAELLGVDFAAFDAELTATVEQRFCGAGGDVPGALAWVCERIGARPTPSQLTAAAEARMAAERGFGTPRPEAVQVLARLRERGLRIGLVSDCSAELPRYFADLTIAPLVDAPTFSFTLGVKKPDPRIFLACCADLGVEPAQCVYVGDGGSDELAGARRVGMRAVHLDVPGERGSTVYGRHAAWDGERVTSLDAVAALLEA